jgi:hypothetical protein
MLDGLATIDERQVEMDDDFFALQICYFFSK